MLIDILIVTQHCLFSGYWRSP